jgi:hypothetical protein
MDLKKGQYISASDMIEIITCLKYTENKKKIKHNRWKAEATHTFMSFV